ncbi:MAG: radical SAM protein, partial [Candidatus Heimdallarchaeaceae archaeon]
MKVRYETFGGIIRTEDPPATLFIDRNYMRDLGFNNSEMWSGEEKITQLSAPINVHFALTNKCPLECKTCYKNAKKQEEDILSLPQIKEIIDILAEMKVFSIAFGGGEPFARKEIFEIAQYTRKKNITPNVTTNGYYINEKNVKKCKIFGHIHVSLDLPNKEFDQIKNEGAFQAANQAIELLTSMSDIHVGINTVLSKANYERLDELIEYGLEKGIYDYAFLRFKPGGKADQFYNEMKLSLEQNKKLFSKLKKLKRKYKINIQVDCSLTPMMLYHKPNRKL